MKRIYRVLFIVIGALLINIPLGTLAQTTQIDNETAEPDKVATVALLGKLLPNESPLKVDDCQEISFTGINTTPVERCRLVAGQNNDSVSIVIMRIQSSGIIFGVQETRQLTTATDALQTMKNQYDSLVARNNDFTKGGVINGDTLSAYVSTSAGVEAFLVDEKHQVSVHYQTQQEQSTITYALHQLSDKQLLTKEWKAVKADSWFLNYAATKHQTGVLPPLKLDEETRRFRTRIGRAYDRGKPNFAGRYLIVSWGCGTACQSHAMVDMQTGRARLLPITTSFGIMYHIDSRLLIANPGSILTPSETNTPDYARPEFWVMQGDSLQSVPKFNR